MTVRENIVHFAQESLGLSEKNAIEIVPFEGRGSDRAYYRLLWSSGNSAILVHYQKSRVENSYFADIAVYLAQNGIPVPSLLRHDEAEGFVLMKDLGDVDIWALRKESWPARKALYEKTLNVVHRLHSLSEDVFPFENVRLMESFGPKLYRWEREYFREHFVEGLCGLSLDGSTGSQLETELSGLADRLSSGKHSLVHRDLQSQNVMIYQDQPYLIDFQGMRFGTPFYDLGSILCDPYVSFETEERLILLAYYYHLSERDIDWSAFQDAFWEASAQRLMQALGAYGFLGMKKGLKNYLAHVPAGIRNLRTAAENAVSLPALAKLCAKIDTKLEIRDTNTVGM